MVCPSKTPIDTHGPECQCPDCRVEQILSDTGGWEWVDDGRPGPSRKPEPRLPWPWLVLEACVWLLVAVAVYLLIWG